jgi:hypothetical protein
MGSRGAALKAAGPQEGRKRSQYRMKGSMKAAMEGSSFLYIGMALL